MGRKRRRVQQLQPLRELLEEALLMEDDADEGVQASETRSIRPNALFLGRLLHKTERTNSRLVAPPKTRDSPRFTARGMRRRHGVELLHRIAAKYGLSVQVFDESGSHLEREEWQDVVSAASSAAVESAPVEPSPSATEPTKRACGVDTTSLGGVALFRAAVRAQRSFSATSASAALKDAQHVAESGSGVRMPPCQAVSTLGMDAEVEMGGASAEPPPAQRSMSGSAVATKASVVGAQNDSKRTVETSSSSNGAAILFRAALKGAT